jgi:hypothetical protein
MEELPPDPADGYAVMVHVDREAALGRVGSTGDRSVLMYLVRYTWRSVPNPDGAGIGQVMRGKAAVRKIAEATGLSRRGVQLALRRLEAAGWIYAEQMQYADGRDAMSLIAVRLDIAAQRDRERLRQEQGERTECADGSELSAQTGAN